MAKVLPEGLSLTWLGHATFLIHTPGGKTILIDPWVENNPACPADRKRIGRCDLMLLTHAHFEHIGDAIPIAILTGAQVVGIVELLSWLQKKGVKNTHAMNKGGTQHFDGIAVTMVHADHSCGITDGDQILYGGEAVGYVVRFENGYTIYHAGDTNVFGDMALIGELYRPDLAMIPIGDHYTMSPLEAAKAVRLIGAKQIVPMHFGTFPVLTGTPEALRSRLADLEEITVHDLKPGDTLT
ncbi:MAG TPA: metal-dependent hydrolase [Chthonomonadales bacterium]|nr:metal-dependent hydrolase [Chthonomonadales bacterium]